MQELLELRSTLGPTRAPPEVPERGLVDSQGGRIEECPRARANALAYTCASEELRPRGPVDGPVDTSTATQRGVRGVDDGIDRQGRDVGLGQLEHAGVAYHDLQQRARLPANPPSWLPTASGVADANHAKGPE
jgi:hypothetical protein